MLTGNAPAGKVHPTVHPNPLAHPTHPHPNNPLCALCHSQDARNRGMNRLVLLTTRTADWFIQRDFVLQGPAWASDLLPAQRRERINPARNSQLYVKELEQVDGATMSQPGKRIGF